MILVVDLLFYVCEQPYFLLPPCKQGIADLWLAVRIDGVRAICDELCELLAATQDRHSPTPGNCH